jgi:exopolysaccharide biosynthesis WecB/TagA/CpsF family protein
MLDPRLEKYTKEMSRMPRAVGFADLNFFSQSLYNEEFNSSLELFDFIYCDGYWLYRMLKTLGYKVSYTPGPTFFKNYIKTNSNFTLLSKYSSEDLPLNVFNQGHTFVQLPFVKNVEDFEYDKIANSIPKGQDIFVSLGCPKQEIFLSRLLALIPEGCTCYAIGAAVDFHLGTEKRAHFIFILLRIEFIWRLMFSSKKQFKKWMHFPKAIRWFLNRVFFSSKF